MFQKDFKMCFLLIFVYSNNFVFTCTYRAIHISPGNVFRKTTIDETITQNDLYIIGFMSVDQCDESLLKLQIWINNQPELEIDLYKSREYSAPVDSKVDYHRFYYFFKIKFTDIEKSPCKFEYQIRHKTSESPIFEFSSNLFCSDFYRIITFGQHDITKIGLRAISSLKHHEFDLLILTGNYGQGINLDNGRIYDKYFDQMEVITSKVLTLAIPGSVEAFDNYQMFQSRFLLPGCHENIDCDFGFLVLDKAYIILPNLHKMLFISQEKNYLMQNQLYKTVIQANSISENDDQKIWKLVFTNVDFYCTENTTSDNCLNLLYSLKNFEDLFEIMNINVVVSSGRKKYEAVRSIYNFVPRFSQIPRNYFISGLAGSTKFYTAKTQTGNNQLSLKRKTKQQSILSLDIFQDYYKVDLLNVPDLKTIELRVVNKKFNWETVFVYLMFLFGIVVMFIVFELFSPSLLGKKLAYKKLKQKREEEEESEEEKVEQNLFEDKSLSVELTNRRKS